MVKEFLFSWISKPQYLWTIVDSIKAIIEILVILVAFYGIARLKEKVIKKYSLRKKINKEE